MAQALPYLSLGLGINSALQSQRYADQAVAPLSKEQQATMRERGTSNIGANLASRGLLDSSLYTGGLADLEKTIAETRNPNADISMQLAQGYGQSAGQTIGNLSQMYWLRKLFGDNPFAGTPYQFIPGGFTGNANSPWGMSQYGTLTPPWFSDITGG